jgi:two-component system chemotaxis sensor kinase CheA
MDELLRQFLVEAPDLVQQAADDLLSLEGDPADADRFDSAFRAFHTLKGSAALFDFAPMGRVLHAAEDLLGAVRDGRHPLNRALTDALLACLNASERWIGTIARTGALPAEAETEAGGLAAGLRGMFAPQHAVPVAPAPAAWLAPLLAREATAVAEARAQGLQLAALRFLPAADCFFLGDDPIALLRSLPEVVALHIDLREPWAAGIEPFTCNLLVEALSTAPAAALRQALRFVADQAEVVEVPAAATPAAVPKPEPEGEAATRSLRVDADRIDGLLDIAGELIVARNALAQVTARAAAQDPALRKALGPGEAELERVVRRLHRAVMDLRMTPLARSFRRFPRLVRDTAARLGKTVELEVVGEAVEADKSLVDGLFEPLLHVLRNAVDHGVEPAEARIAAGKPAAGRIRLEARREGDRILILVADDGRGVDAARLREAAKRRRIMDDAAIDALDDAAAANLVFAPGFSTAAAVTEISGRGVGMDAVRIAVEGMGGHVALASRPGQGATVSITLPRAVVVTTVLTVRLGEEVFGIPIDAVLSTARIPLDRVQRVRHGEAFVQDDRTIPLLRLASLLERPAPPRAGRHVHALVADCRGQPIGVEVDAFAERLDVLLRPLTGLLAGVPGLLGAAPLGDGQVLIVLDLPELVG